MTGNGQQSASFVQLSDGSLVLAFGHKDAGEGQKFILSYDGKMALSLFSPCTRVANLKSILNAGGISWSNGVWDLHRGGLYASSVPVGDDEVVTAYSCATDSQSMCPERGGKLSECLAVLVACGFSTSLIGVACVLCSDAAVEAAGLF